MLGIMFSPAGRYVTILKFEAKLFSLIGISNAPSLLGHMCKITFPTSPSNLVIIYTNGL